MEVPRKLKERHLALLFKQDGRAFRAIAWRAADREGYLTTNRLVSSSRIRSSKASIAARKSRSCRSPTCGSPRSSRHEMAALRACSSRSSASGARSALVAYSRKRPGPPPPPPRSRRPGRHRAERRRPPRPPQRQRGSRHDRLPEHENDADGRVVFEKPHIVSAGTGASRRGPTSPRAKGSP
jgi:hypothetical protein